jgi:hypothetical protein
VFFSVHQWLPLPLQFFAPWPLCAFASPQLPFRSVSFSVHLWLLLRFAVADVRSCPHLSDLSGCIRAVAAVE